MRPKADGTELAPARMYEASFKAFRESRQWQHAQAPWVKAASLFEQYCYFRLAEGDGSPLVWSAKVAVAGQVRVTADLLYRDPRIRKRWSSVFEICQVLASYLGATIGGPVVVFDRPLHVKSPAGNTLGGEREYAARWRREELLEVFPRIVEKLRTRYLRERTRRPAWIKDIAKELRNVTPLTVLGYLERYPELQACLDEARTKNKTIVGRGPSRG